MFASAPIANICAHLHCSLRPTDDAGLVILDAKYGDLNSTKVGGVVNVTVPMQCLVDEGNSMIIIKAGTISIIACYLHCTVSNSAFIPSLVVQARPNLSWRASMILATRAPANSMSSKCCYASPALMARQPRLVPHWRLLAVSDTSSWVSCTSALWTTRMLS